jgi:hypothetical protein
MSTISGDSPHTQVTNAISQLSEQDRTAFLRLKEKYGIDLLAQVLLDDDPMLGKIHQSLSIKSKSNGRTERLARWKEYRSPRESTGSSTLYMNSVDGDTYCSSVTSRSSCNLQDQPLWKRRAASLPRSARNKSKSRSSRNSHTDEPREIRINIIKPELPEETIAVSATHSQTTYFCTTCERSFEHRKVWAEHEYENHERQYFWSCQETGCSQFFMASASFEKHHQEVHGCQSCNHAYSVKRSLPSKRSWGCGFDGCEGVFDSWEKRCDHVAAHFEEIEKEEEALPSQWKYTNMIRNLLRQADVRDAYFVVMLQCHGEDQEFWPRMTWQAKNTTELKRRLEYRDFREGVKEIARGAVQLGHPPSSESIKIVMEQAESPAEHDLPISPAMLPQDPNYLSHIDKFPQPGTNPFDLYGPVPPSPIIQLDFLSNLNDPDPKVDHVHSTKSSLSGISYSLYPSPAVNGTETPPIGHPLSKPPGPLTPPELIHEIAVPTEPITFQTAATWATAFSNAKETTSPTRPKTPLAMIRSARSLIKKKSHGQIYQLASAEPFDAVSAQKEIQFYQAR